MFRNTPTIGKFRRGVTSLIAMMYLVLISSVAVGFYALTTTSSQVSLNDDHTSRAYLAAESGMDFMRRQMAKVHVPSNVLPQNSIDYYYPNLQTQLNGTNNLGSLTISKSGNTIFIPHNGTIKLDSAGNARFAATITDWGSYVVVKVDGYFGTAGSSGVAQRSISMDFTRQQRKSSIFDYAVASKGQVVMKKGTVSATNGVNPNIATLFSALASGISINMTGGTLGGDLNLMDTASVSVTGGSVGGSSIIANILADHVHTTDTAPEFPTIDPSVYKQYAVNAWVDKAKVQKNILIKKNTNPKFNANDKVQGIMYVESPNQVTFNGDFKMDGFIVMETSASTTDTLSFSGNLTQSPIPNQPEFNAVRAITGVSVLAPNAAMSMTGSSGGAVKGNIIVKSFSFQGAANLQIDLGSILTYSAGTNSAFFNGSKSILFSATGGNNMPSQGVTYSQYYMAKPDSYQELIP